MKPEVCEFEDAVTAALYSGEWDATLREHVVQCPQCAELRDVCQSLAHAALTVGDTNPVPAPGLIWWRAQLAERREQAERAVAAIELMRKLAGAVTLIVLAMVLWFWKPDGSLVDRSAVLMGVSMLVVSGAVLYGWARGRI